MTTEEENTIHDGERYERMCKTIERATFEIVKDAEVIKKQKLRISDLKMALNSLISTWDEPGPMGVLYEMPRALSYAKRLLELDNAEAL